MHHSQPSFFDSGALYLLEILLQEVQMDVKLSTHDLIHQEYLQVVFLLWMCYFPLELASSLLGSAICPSVSCCIQVLGLHVAVTVGWDEDPSGKLILGLLVPLGSISRVTGGVVMEVIVVVVGTSGTSTTYLSQTSVDAY